MKSIVCDNGLPGILIRRSTKARLCYVANLRLSLISTSPEETRVRAVYEVDSITADSLIESTEPRMGDFVTVQVGPEAYQNYQVQVTRAEVLQGLDADLGENELLLSLHGFWCDGWPIASPDLR